MIQSDLRSTHTRWMTDLNHSAVWEIVIKDLIKCCAGGWGALSKSEHSLFIVLRCLTCKVSKGVPYPKENTRWL
jgi:hypothetical protein